MAGTEKSHGHHDFPAEGVAEVDFVEPRAAQVALSISTE